MKVKNYLALTLMAAVAFTSCSKEENGAAGDNTPKSVTLTLSNVVAGSRAADAPVPDASKVALNDLQVFFAKSNGDLVQGMTLDNTPAQHYFTMDGFDAREDKVFHFLPAEVTKVIVVGNLGAASDAKTASELKRALEIAAEQDDANLSLYDEVMLTTVIGKDDAGHPLYQVNLTLEPRVARIEVASFEYQARLGSDGAELPRDYESISVEQIVLNNYYNQAAFVAGTVSGDKTNELIDAGTAFGFFAAAANAGLWNNDMFGTADLPAVDLAAAGDYTMAYTDGAKRPAYHFFPKADKIAADDHPQLVVKLTGTKSDGTKSALYLATRTFDPAVTNDIAKIYQVRFAFDDGNLSNPEKCVEVNVDVVAWDVVPVIAEF